MHSTRIAYIKDNTGESGGIHVRLILIAISALYNQTWNTTYATNKGQYRGSDHYTIQSSYISSNATYPGLCAQPATTKILLDLTATTFSYPPFLKIQPNAQPNLVTIYYDDPFHDFYSTTAVIKFPVVANQIYEVSFDYFQEVTADSDGSYYVEVGDDDYSGFRAYISWVQEIPGGGTYQGQSDPTKGAMDACWKDKVMPQTAPKSGVWNTGKLYMRPRTNSAHLRWDFSDVETTGLRWKNVYVTQLPADYCSSGK